MARDVDEVGRQLALSLNQIGPSAVAIILSDDDWYDVIESLRFSLDEEDLNDEERENVLRLHNRLQNKLREHRRRIKKQAEKAG